MGSSLFLTLAVILLALVSPPHDTEGQQLCEAALALEPTTSPGEKEFDYRDDLGCSRVPTGSQLLI